MVGVTLWSTLSISQWIVLTFLKPRIHIDNGLMLLWIVITTCICMRRLYMGKKGTKCMVRDQHWSEKQNENEEENHLERNNE